MTTQIDGTLGVDNIKPGAVQTADIAPLAVTPDKVSNFNTLGNYANDAAAAVGLVPVGGMYRNGSVIQVRIA